MSVGSTPDNIALPPSSDFIRREQSGIPIGKLTASRWSIYTKNIEAVLRGHFSQH